MAELFQQQVARFQGFVQNHFPQFHDHQHSSTSSAGTSTSVNPSLLGTKPISIKGGSWGLPLVIAKSKKAHDVPDMSGTWVKDKVRSECMDDAISMMKLNGLVRQAVKLVRGVKIDQTDAEFTLTVFSIFAWFKVKERYSMSGQSSMHKRRDLRRGQHTGVIQPQGDSLLLSLQWGAPMGGNGTDHFKLVNPDELHIDSTINLEGRVAKYKTVYNRKKE